MQNIPPSEQMRHALQDSLRSGVAGSAQPASQLLRLAAQLVLQQAQEAEVSDNWQRIHISELERTPCHFRDFS